MQIWKSSYIFASYKKIPWKFRIFTLKVSELFTRKVSEMFVYKYTETREYIKK